MQTYEKLNKLHNYISTTLPDYTVLFSLSADRRSVKHKVEIDPEARRVRVTLRLSPRGLKEIESAAASGLVTINQLH